MKLFVFLTVFASVAMLLGACANEAPRKHTGSQTHYLAPANQPLLDPIAQPGEAQPAPPPSEPTKPKVETKPSNPVIDQPVAKGNIPYAKPVPGMPGFVFSPYDQTKGYIDVRGFPPGTEVQDPYSSKIFLVP